MLAVPLQSSCPDPKCLDPCLTGNGLYLRRKSNSCMYYYPLRQRVRMMTSSDQHFVVDISIVIISFDLFFSY